MFQLRYQDLESGEKNDLPIVLHLSGGPGQPGIKDDEKTFYRQIRIDLRGIGCNKTTVTSPDEFFDSEIFATDVVAIIETLKLKHYIIEGTSYGTALGTIVASKLDKSTYKPQALIFEGTVGRAYNQSDIRAAYVARWNQIWTSFSTQTQNILREKNPLGLSGTQWGQAIALFLSLGHAAPGEDATVKFLNQALSCEPQLSSSECSSKRSKIKPVIEQFRFSGVDSYQDQLYFHTMCRELSPGGHELDFILSEGRLIPDPKDHCNGVTLSKPFYAEQFPYSIPTFYFSGGLDVGTPPWQTLYHVNANTHSPRTIITVPEGGHNSLGKGLKDCKDAVLREILTNGGAGLQVRLADPTAHDFIPCKMLSRHPPQEIYRFLAPL